jgi:hypothetical protein
MQTIVSYCDLDVLINCNPHSITELSFVELGQINFACLKVCGQFLKNHITILYYCYLRKWIE